MNSSLVIRQIVHSEILQLARIFQHPWLSSQESKEKWQRYFEEHTDKKRVVCIVEYENIPVGYGTLLLQSFYLFFKQAHIPEINDIRISPEYRNKGFGSSLIKKLEQIARELGYQTVGLGVGLYSDYGSAQKLYVKLGYVPNGLGITYKYEPVIAGNKYPIDDHLLLWLTKTI